MMNHENPPKMKRWKHSSDSAKSSQQTRQKRISNSDNQLVMILKNVILNVILKKIKEQTINKIKTLMLSKLKMTGNSR